MGVINQSNDVGRACVLSTARVRGARTEFWYPRGWSKCEFLVLESKFDKALSAAALPAPAEHFLVIRRPQP
jgi:hypothetical protein